MTPEEFVSILRRHERHTRGLTGGARADLSHQTLAGLRLSALNLRGAKLAGVDFSGCDLAGTDFAQADLFGANFEGSKSSGASFEGADLRGSRFRNATLEEANFREADLRPGKLLDAKRMLRAGASAGEPGGPKPVALTEVDVHNASVAKSKLRGNSTARVDMHGVNLSRANLEAARLD